SRVDLPAPDGPCRTRHWPGATSKEISSSTSRTTPCCWCKVKVLASPRTCMAEFIIVTSGLENGRHQQLAVGVLRVVQDLVGQACLHHARATHDHQAVRKQASHGQVVCHDD